MNPVRINDASTRNRLQNTQGVTTRPTSSCASILMLLYGSCSIGAAAWLQTNLRAVSLLSYRCCRCCFIYYGAGLCHVRRIPVSCPCRNAWLSRIDSECAVLFLALLSLRSLFIKRVCSVLVVWWRRCLSVDSSGRVRVSAALLFPCYNI